MTMQVHGSCCGFSAVAASGAVGRPAESVPGRSAIASSSSAAAAAASCSGFCPALSSSRRTVGTSRKWAVEGARTRAGKRRGGAVVVRASTGRPSGKDESKAVYDAFFLGKAVAEAVSERVGSAIGEFLSDVGRRQAEQQKRIREFQDDVQARAAAAALKAAQKALARDKEDKPVSPPPPSPSPAQPPPSTSGLSNPDDAPTSVSFDR